MTPEHAIKSGDPEALNQLLQPIFDRDAYEEAKKEGRLMATGLPAGPGAASGAVVFTAAKAEELAAKGKNVVLARIETSPEDLRGMIAADGILTAAAACPATRPSSPGRWARSASPVPAIFRSTITPAS